MIFISAPYTHPDKAVVAKRYNDLCHIVGELLKRGKICISPNIFGHAVAEKVKDLPTDWDFWKKYCIAFLSKCDVVYVIMFDGWDTSTGVKYEIDLAKDLGIKIEYIDPATYLN